jgi:hypothetical protein
MAESVKKVTIVVGGVDAGASAVFTGVGAEAKKLAGLERTLADARREYLANEAAAGSELAQFEVKRLGVAKDYAQQRERINTLLVAETSTEQQKLAAAELLLKITQQEADAVAKLNAERATILGGTPGVQQDEHVARFQEEKQFREFITAERQKEADVERGIAAARETSLRNEADAGSKSAAMDLERLGISKAYAAQRVLIADLLKAESLTATQRVELEALQVKLTHQEAAALRLVGQEQAKNGKGGLSGVKSLLGEESGAGMALKALRGAGAVAVVGLVTRMLADSTGKAAELSKELRSGAKGAGDVADELLRALPVIGNIYTAGQNIREVLTGEQASIESMRHGAELVGKAIDSWRDNLRQTQNDHKDILDTIRQIRHEADLLSLPAGQREAAGAAFASADRARQVAKSIQDKLDAANKKTAADIAPLQAELDKTIVPQLVEENRTDGGYGSAASSNADEVRAAQDKRAALQRNIESLRKQLKDGTATLQKDLATALAENARAAALVYVDRLKLGIKDAVNAAREAAQQIVDAKNEGRAAELQSLGKNLDAELLLIRAGLQKELDEIERARQEKAKAAGDPNFGIYQAGLQGTAARERAANAELGAGRADGDRAIARQQEEQERANASEQRKRDADEFIRQQKLASAEELAAQGKLSHLEVERLQIAEQYLQRRKQITEQMAQEGITLDQRAALMKQLQGLEGEEKAAKARVGTDNTGGRFASAGDTRVGGAFFALRESINTELRKPPEVEAIQKHDTNADKRLEKLKSYMNEAIAAAFAGIQVFNGGGTAPQPPR